MAYADMPLDLAVGPSLAKVRWKCLALVALLSQLSIVVTAGWPQTPPKKNVLIINEVGISHSATAIVTQEILDGVRETPDLHVEFYSESLDLISSPDRPTPTEIKAWLVKKYGAYKLDAVVAVGPGAINFLGRYTQTMFLDVPIVICGSSAFQAGNPRLDSRFTGTWLNLQPAKTLELALRLFPRTRHVAVVGGSSNFDKKAESMTMADFAPFTAKLDVIDLTRLEMNDLLKRLRELPEQTVVVYTSFFEDAAGQKFINTTKALPMIAETVNAPVFGMSDTYFGYGIVGGNVVSLREQSKITAHLVSELLAGKKAQDIPITTNPNFYMFDWNAMNRWHISANSLPAGSIVLFREASLWERTKWIWIIGLFIVFGLATLAVYLHHGREQLRRAEEKGRQLGGMLINAQEKERSRLAAELHDDFSQRLAVLALGLETAAETLSSSSPVAKQQLVKLCNRASELGADLHTLSHRLHSSTLESLGLVPGASALCREFASQQGMKIDFSTKNVPPTVNQEVALCLFRIIQEGLRNLQKHSGAANAQVGLQKVGNKLLVTVRDQGRGFDPAGINGREGLGIRSMQERVRLLGGRFEIHSAPGKGTSIEAWVPLELGLSAKA